MGCYQPAVRGGVPTLHQRGDGRGINTPLRRAAFLAQLAHESGELQWFEEFADGWDYEWREDLGNIYEGDGPLYKGRGPIQLTGRHNYTRAGEALGLDLVNDPWQVATPEVGFRTACWYWNYGSAWGDLNAYADTGDFDSTCRFGFLMGRKSGERSRSRSFGTRLKGV